jgi:hypothetical protein
VRKKIMGSVLAVLIIFTVGCSKKDATSTRYEEASPKSEMKMDTSNSVSNGAKANLTATATSDKSTVTQDKIIQTGDMQIIVEDLKLSATDIRTKMNELGGYIESERLSEVNSFSKVRVPADKLQAFIKYLEEKYEVKVKNFSTQNVTDAYVDNDARIRNLKAQEAQVLEIMKKANTVEEILKVQGELSKVRGEVESLESRKKVWDKDVDFSAVSVTASIKSTAVPTKSKVLSGSEFGKSISSGFKGSTTALILFFQNIIVFLLSNILLIIILGLAVFFGFRSYIKRNK